MKIKEFTEKILGIKVEAWQEKFLEAEGDLRIGPIRRHGKKYNQK